MTKHELENISQMTQLWDAEIERHSESREEVARLQAENSKLKKQLAQLQQDYETLGCFV